jgi:hypothetical protein
MALIVAVSLEHVLVPAVNAYVPPWKSTVSPATATLCAWAIDAQGAASVPAALSLPVGET